MIKKELNLFIYNNITPIFSNSIIAYKIEKNI